MSGKCVPRLSPLVLSSPRFWSCCPADSSPPFLSLISRLPGCLLPMPRRRRGMIQSVIFLLRMRRAAVILFLALGPLLASGQFNPNLNPFQPGNFQPQFQQNVPQQHSNINTMGGKTEYDGNLVWYGFEAGDQQISDNQRQNGMQIKLHNMFPYYGGRYNYTMISTNGFISFAYFSDDQSTLQIGLDADWPTQSDPALIAPYLCKQRIQSGQGTDSQIYYRLEVRKNTAHQMPVNDGSNQPRRGCLGKPDYYRCDQQSDDFLDQLQRSLMQGVAGASTFRAEAALVVTWKNMRPNIGSERGLSTYQLVWMADAQGLQSYTMINYQKLGFEAADLQGNSRTGKCQAVFNGGNHTGNVQVDLNEMTKLQPSSLASRSSVPHVVRGRYFHRVDDIVRPAGCSNKTGGTFPLLIYPNIVSMLGQTTVDVNGLCLTYGVTYVLMIEQRETAPCVMVNPSIARCTMPKIQDWGTKTVYFQPQSGLSNDEKAYVGFIYFVPPTIDPMRLDIGDIHSWYMNPAPSPATIKWYPRNFTNIQLDQFNQDPGQRPQIYDDAIYNVQLGLYIVGYREAQDVNKRKWVPQHKVLARWTTYSNRAEESFRWNPMVERLPMDHQIDQWYLTDDEQREELFEYRFGYLKLAVLHGTDNPVPSGKHQKPVEVQIPDGIISSPISLHWLWTLTRPEVGHANKNKEEKAEFVKEKAKEMCHAWYNEDGALNNFIRDTEQNASCPCMEKQAKMDLGRFMPHPRCSNLFRDVSCTETLGAMNCYMSAQNVYGSSHKKNKHGYDEYTNYATHYGQTCCYDSKGFLMQSSYQPVVKIDESTPYSPGFPTRAYEMGSDPYQGMFEVPGLSTFHHDIMPYYLCCKYADFRCQMFYWRRPSSACQAYEPPVTGSIMGAGVISTLTNRNLIFNDPGVYTLLHSHKSRSTPEVQIQVRMERFPDRSVDFGSRNIEQRDLVQPTNATVVTGVVLSAEDADRVHVLLRKDTRRGRYKTSIIVGNVIRYFDNMHLQRFRGVTVYVNNVEKGQAEIYVVLDQAQIGMRIRESYAIDIDRKFQYEESLGLLDVQISVPPQYKVMVPGVTRVRELEDPHVEGLINPFPDETVYDTKSTVTWSNVNDQGVRQQLMKYKIKGDEDTQNMNLHADDVRDLFQARSEQEKTFQAFADHFLKGPVYKVSSYYQMVPFYPWNEAEFRNFIIRCKERSYDVEYLTKEQRKMYGRCPLDPASLEADCGNDVTCLYDAVMLQARVLGDESRESFNSYIDQRIDGTRRYNSCGAMNIEYPEYLIKGPSSGQQAYLEGATISFSCFQTHIMMGETTDFSCQRYQNSHDNTFRYQWTQGEQPWCRHRAKDNILTWLMWTAIALGVLLIPICIFFACWTLKIQRKNKLKKQQEKNSVEMVPLNTFKSAAPSEGGDTSSDIARLDREPGTRSKSKLPELSAPPSRGPSPYSQQQPISYRRNNRPGELSV